MDLESSLRKLTHQQRIYVESRLSGMNQLAAGAAAGLSVPRVDSYKVEQLPAVQEAMLAAMQVSAEEIGFSRKEAHDLLMQAYWNADTAGEQIAAVREMIKLHGVAAPQQVEVNHKHVHQGELHLLSNDELMRLADMNDDLVLEGEFTEVEESRLLEHDGQEPEATDGDDQDTGLL